MVKSGGESRLRVEKVIAVLLLLMVAGVAVTAATATNNAVSLNEAKKVAEKFIAKISATEDFREWKDAKIGKVVTCYDVDESPSAYVFEFAKNGKYAGYIVVSAKKTSYPVLEFSKGISPLMRAMEMGIKTEKVYYLGALTYFFKEKRKCYDLMGREINFENVKEGVRKAIRDERVREHLAKRAKEAKEQWEKYSSEITTLAWYGVHIQGVPALLWYRGCTPTAAAMVLGYWDQHGYPNFPDDYQTTLIDELADAMGTWDNGYTPQWQVSGGINTVCNNHGYGNWASDVWWVTWDMVTDEIDASRPFVLTMVLQSTYTWHSVTVIGYAIDIDTNSKYILLYDTWDTDVHYIAFGSWIGANAHKVVPT